MADPIRPSLSQIPIPRQAGTPGDAARAAQRAFFSQAMNAAQADGIAPAAPAAPVQRRAAVERIDIPAEQPERSVRPGSYLDIKV